MKFNLVNKIYIGMAVALVLASLWKIWRFKPWDRHYFFASVNAPYTFPIYIRDIYFLYPVGDEYGEGFSYTREEVNNFNSHWGNEYYSPRVSDPLRFPKQLVLQYVSYRDKKFYRDTLDLPQQLIEDTFKEAKEKNQLLVMSTNLGGEEKKGLHFVVGIANDGNLMVWLRGVYLEKLLLKTQLKAREPKAEDLYYAKPLSKQEYYDKMFRFIPDTLKDLIDRGVDRNAKYIDSPTHYIELNKDYWEAEKKRIKE
ncbi:DUF2931 family protein [Pedobacter chitinilyticus]|uniref:DUF2931 family protein n=1 Tax=Pedobacter chitinilyticus TaxID=2233776 RepID=A0A443YVU9_9SPHI|nr:DUF2931 family protein [Pedobacter chitinilyticus]RWU08093.1 DUF2931 family protein [Pedobacter chitinilyticus]